jgi:hypothetical protein
MKKFLAGVLSAGALLGALAFAAAPSQAADHLDADLVKKDGRTDINDIYAFQSPDDAGKTALIMTVNPGAGVISGTSFSNSAWYVFNLDDNGDAKPDRRFHVAFGAVDRRGKQLMAVYGPDRQGRERFLGAGYTGDTIRLRGGGSIQADVYDDPFFFDLAAFRNNLQFCPGGVGTDFFLGLNVSAIVLEVPDSSIGSGDVGVWANTRDRATYAPIDRMGRPAINTVFIDSASKDRFNAVDPAADQAVFRGQVVSVLQALGNDETRANALADVLLPDILTFNLDNPAGFLNGRQLADDVIDAELALITNGAVPTDCVDNDSVFRSSFPYLGVKN